MPRPPVPGTSVISPSHGSTPSGSPLLARKDATSSSERPATKVQTANEHIFVKLVGGTTLRPIVQSLPQIKSPFPIDIWRDTLHNHLDSDLMKDLLHDIEYGVRIGFHHDGTPLISSNHFLAISNPAPLAKELERKLSLNRKAGPLLVPPFFNFVGSPMGAIPKKHSQPVGQSINDAIPKELYSCSYDSIDNAIAHLKTFASNALMSKLDLSDAFRDIQVDP